jgi:hypothetical protein
VEQIVAVMREASDDPHGYRLRALVVVLWRAGLRVAEALSLGEREPRHDVDLPAGHRHRGDHRHRPRPARADDVRLRRTPSSEHPTEQRERRSRSPLEPATARKAMRSSQDLAGAAARTCNSSFQAPESPR